MRSRTAAELFLKLPLGVRLAVLHRLGRFAPWEEQFDFTPPPLAAGENAGPPDFVGIGVQKAGTSWWYSLITAHPGVTDHSHIHKERHFLSRFGSQPFSDAEIERYHGWFPRSPGTMAGEWTPDYMWFPWVAPLMKRAAPQARILVMLRDPVERFRSGLAHQIRDGKKRTGATVTEVIDRGFYDRQLSGWEQFLTAGQILVLQFEQCVKEPEIQLARTYRFLGLDDSFKPAHVSSRVNETTTTSPSIDPEVRARLKEIYEPDVVSLVKRGVGLDLSLWPHFSGL
ncbi:MAG: sulfotransferase [Acidimicrobiales bacterium]